MKTIRRCSECFLLIILVQMIFFGKKGLAEPINDIDLREYTMINCPYGNEEDKTTSKVYIDQDKIVLPSKIASNDSNEEVVSLPFEKDNLSSTTMYEYLGKTSKGKELQKLYRLIKNEMVKLYYSKEDYKSIDIVNSNNDYKKTCPISVISMQGLDTQMRENMIYSVYISVYYDNPYLYFLRWIPIYDYEHINLYICMDDEYALYSRRKKYFDNIDKVLVDYKKSTEAFSKVYEKVLVVHDKMIRENEYDFNLTNNDSHYNQNIIGVMDKDISKTICAGYASATNLIMNYIGVECKICCGMAYTSYGKGGHAWNEVKFDDGNWYGYDVTWDEADYIMKDNEFYDSNSFCRGVSYNYFGVSKSEFEKGHKLSEWYFFEIDKYEEVMSILATQECPYSYKNIMKDETFVKKDGVSYKLQGIYAKVVGYDGVSSNLVIPEKVDNHIVVAIGNGAFAGCSKLESITIPDTVVVIDDGDSMKNGAFYNCNNLKRVQLGNYVNHIGKWAFAECKNLNNINVPIKLNNVYYNAFHNCPSGKELIYLFLNRYARNKVLSDISFDEYPTKENNYNAKVYGKNISQYFSLNDTIARVDNSGNLTSYNGGKTVIVGKNIASDGTVDYATCVVNIKSRNYSVEKDIAITNFKASCEYTGKDIVQNIKLYKDNRVLVENEDYYIIYKDNKNIGTASMTITGMGDFVGSITKTFNIVLNKVKTINKIRYSTNSITFAWNAVSKATGYRIERYNETTKKYDFIKNVSGTSFTDVKLLSSKCYRYRIQAYCGKYLGLVSDSFVYITKPAKVSKVSLSLTKANKIKVSFTSVARVSSYQIFRRTGKNGKLKLLKELNYKKLNFIDNGVRKKGLYYYVVRGVKLGTENKVVVKTYGDCSSQKGIRCR